MNPNREKLIPLHRDVHHDRQSWFYTALWQHGEERLKVYIRCDCSYDFQSDFRISIWSRPKMEWSFLAEIHYSQAESLPNSSVSDHVTTADFARDEAVLLDRALMVIPPRSSQAAADSAGIDDQLGDPAATLRKIREAAEEYDEMGRDFPLHHLLDIFSIAKAKTPPGSEAPTIRIEVRGGAVQRVSNVPPGWVYEIIDHDNAE